MNKQSLARFQRKIARIYEKAKIHAPVHLSGDNEEQLIKIFKDYKKGDWIFSTWRSHYHWLLSGRSLNNLENQILNGDSMHINDEKFFTSAIVGGISPIALGVAMALKKKKSKNKVWCFIGDAAFECGISKESIRYAKGHDLPITYVIEDNGLCVSGLTQEIWGKAKAKVTKKYKYKRRYPHAGSGKYVMF